MSKLSKVLSFIVTNRRALGVIIGTTLTLSGLPEWAGVVNQVANS